MLAKGPKFLKKWSGGPRKFWSTGPNFLGPKILTHLDDRETIQMHTKLPINECLLHYQLPKPS